MFKRLFKKLRERSGVSAIELLISISIMSILAYPAYLSMRNGSVLFHNESIYQDTLTDVHSFYEEINSKIRLSGFNDHELIDTQEKLLTYPELSSKITWSDFTILRIGQVFYYSNDSKVIRLIDDNETFLVENVVNFEVSDLDDKTLITFTTTISVNGRQESIKTSVYDRY